VKADVMLIAPATMLNGFVIVKRNNNTKDTLEVNREKWEVLT
jgi:hypothetical protein